MFANRLKQLIAIGNDRERFSIADVDGNGHVWMDAATLQALWDAAIHWGTLIQYPRLVRFQAFHVSPGPNQIFVSVFDARERDGLLIATLGLAPEEGHASLFMNHTTLRTSGGIYFVFDHRLTKIHTFQQMMADDDRARSRGLFDGKVRRPVPIGQRVMDLDIPGVDELFSIPHFVKV